MSRKTTIMSLLLICIMTGSIMAQSSQVLYFMNIPQKSSLNPAFQPGGRMYVGLPVISDFSLRIDNNFLSFSDLFENGVVSDSTLVFLKPGTELDSFLDGLHRKNSIEPRLGFRMFGLAFTIGKDLRITFDINERVEGNFAIPGDVIRLGVKGPESFMGKDLDLTSLRTDIMYYHETGIGASKNITDKLRIGGRLMILGGVAAGYLDNNALSLRVNDDFTQTVNADIAFNVSAPVKFYKHDGVVDSAAFDQGRFEDANSVISYIIGTGNTGMGIELGAEYRFNDMFVVSAALNNLGFIKWERDRSSLIVKKQFELNGLTMQDVYDESLSFDELINWAIDSVQNATQLVESARPFTTFLPFGVTTAFGFSPVRFFTAGVLSQTRFRGKQVHQSFTLSGNLNFGNVFSTSLAYTIANHRYDNLGFGFAVRGGFAQFFTVVDNIPMRWSTLTSGESTTRIPENWYTIHARLGLNFVFGNRENEKPLPPM